MAKCVYRIACRYGVLTTPIEHVLRLTPPLTISETLVDEAMDKLKLAIAEACALSSRVA
jgi:4-aminobutyrate aminotransferase-like enzyme